MRRALPWVTVGLLVLGVGAGVGLGIAGQTPTPAPLTATGQISRIVAATRRAGTARFTYSSSSTSTKIVNSSNSRDAAPSPNDRAGLARPCPNVTSLGAFFATHCCT